MPLDTLVTRFSTLRTDSKNSSIFFWSLDPSRLRVRDAFSSTASSTLRFSATRFSISGSTVPGGWDGPADPTIWLKTSSGSTSLYIGLVGLDQEMLRLIEHGL